MSAMSVSGTLYQSMKAMKTTEKSTSRIVMSAWPVRNSRMLLSALTRMSVSPTRRDS